MKSFNFAVVFESIPTNWARQHCLTYVEEILLLITVFLFENISLKLRIDA
jgi:hypothetical protein